MRAPAAILFSALMALAQGALAQVINLPAGSPIPQNISPGTTVIIGGVVVISGTAAIAATPNTAVEAARGGASREEEKRRSFGAIPGLNMRIQGDGIALPTGVGRKAEVKAEIERDKREEAAKKAAEEKAKADADKGLAGTPPGLENPRSPGSPDKGVEDGKDKTRKPVEPPQAVKPALPEGGRETARVRPGGPLVDAKEEKQGDSVATRIDRGLERDPGTTRPMDLKTREGPGTGAAIAVPRCFGESREGENC